MAESGNKIIGIGFPFGPDTSSCSNIEPTNFNWSTQDGLAVVHMDYGLGRLNIEIPKQKRFGWLCESKFIISDVYNFLIQNHKVLFENYFNKIFTYDSDLLKLNSNFIYCPNGSNYPWVRKNEWGIHKKNKICSMFCSDKKMSEGHIYRQDVAKIAIECGLDVFGGAHGTIRTVVDSKNPWNTKGEGLRDYAFSIVMENGVSDTYFTEKITDCFATGTIPIYWGTKNISNYFDANGIVWLEHGKEKEILNNLNLDLYSTKLESIKNNFNILQHFKIADDYMFDQLIKYI